MPCSLPVCLSRTTRRRRDGRGVRDRAQSSADDLCETEDPTRREAWPCCGYVTLAERGMCLICDVCFWDDDPFIRNAHHVYSILNRTMLAGARNSFAATRGAEARSLGHIPPFAARAHIERRPVELTRSVSATRAVPVLRLHLDPGAPRAAAGATT